MNGRLPGLDLLRAVAIVSVMLYHLESYGVSLPAFVHFGWMGVDLFFVLSGYLIGWQLLKPYTCGQQQLWGRFMFRRAMRVLPAYVAVLCVYLAISGARESPGMAPLWQFLTFSANLFPDYLHNRAFSHAWSLCVEEHFYLLLPASVWFLARRPSAKAVVLAALSVMVAGMLLRGWLRQHEVAPFLSGGGGERNFVLRYVEAIYNPTYTRLDGLLAGVMLAAMKAFRPAWWSRVLAWAPAFLLVGVAGIVAVMRIEPVSLAGAVLGFPLLAASLACVVIAAVSPLGRFAVPGARHVAMLSFSLYLTHKQVYHWLQDSVESNLLAFVVQNCAALAVAALLYVAIERPGLWLRDWLAARWSRNAPLQAAALG